MQYIEDVHQERHEDIAETLLVEKEQVEGNDAQKAIKNEKSSYGHIKENLDWIQAIIKEAGERNLCEDVYVKLVDAFRIAKVRVKDVAPKAKKERI